MTSSSIGSSPSMTEKTTEQNREKNHGCEDLGDKEAAVCKAGKKSHGHGGMPHACSVSCDKKKKRYYNPIKLRD